MKAVLMRVQRASVTIDELADLLTEKVESYLAAE